MEQQLISADSPATDQLEGRPTARPTDMAAGPGTAAAIDLYNATSSLPLRMAWQAPMTDHWHHYLQLVYAQAGQPLHATTSGPAHPWAELDPSSGECWVQFTGGKDSTAAALAAEEQGYRVRPYYLAGLNRGMADEPRYATAICEARGWQLHMDSMAVRGKKQGVLEPPTKNQVSALAMHARMALAGDGTWTAGWHYSDTQDRQLLGYDYSDGHDMIARGNAYLQVRYPGSRYIGHLRDTTECWARVAAAGLLGYVKGCVCPLRHKARRRAANELKFGPLLPGRCGSCVKCAWEQVALERLGVLPHNPDLRAHGGKWLQRDTAEKLGLPDGELPTVAEAEDYLVPWDEVRRARQLVHLPPDPVAVEEWPQQPPPPGGLGQ